MGSCFPVNLFRIQDFDEKLADAAAQVQEAPKTKPASALWET